MSKRTFVILGLTVNFVICVAMSFIHFADTDKKQKVETALATTKAEQEATTTQSTSESTPIATSDKIMNQTTEATKQTIEQTTEQITEPTTELTTEQITEPTTQPTTESTTEQVTEPITEPTSQPITEPTTNPPQLPTTPTYINGKTKVQIQNSCNIRSTPDLNASVIGTTRVGEQYPLITTKCDDYWLAISYNGITGYISNDFGLLLP